MERWVTVAQAARAVGRSPATIHRWCTKESLPHDDTIGIRRILWSDLAAFCGSRRRPEPDLARVGSDLGGLDGGHGTAELAELQDIAATMAGVAREAIGVAREMAGDYARVIERLESVVDGYSQALTQRLTPHVPAAAPSIEPAPVNAR